MGIRMFQRRWQLGFALDYTQDERPSQPYAQQPRSHEKHDRSMVLLHTTLANTWFYSILMHLSHYG
eukprot:6115873-Amphidinium_carterae.1